MKGAREMAGNIGVVAELVGSNEQAILSEWVDLQKWWAAWSAMGFSVGAVPIFSLMAISAAL